jgi:hypothetical protein
MISMSTNTQATPVPEAVMQDEALDLLKLEYTSLLGLYTHTENTIFSIFNFYLTLLSAIVGAIVVLIQINNANLNEALPSISGLLMLTVLIGVIMQTSIVNKNIDLSIYTLGINLVKHRLFRNQPQELSNIFFMHNFWAKVHPIRTRSATNSRGVSARLWWLLPMGTNQLFISLIDSLALSALVVIARQLVAGASVAPQSLVLSAVLVAVISFEIHAVYARLKHRRGLKNIATVNGREVAWINIK